MTQSLQWDKEYQKPKFLSNSFEPQLDFKHFIKWLKKKDGIVLDGIKALDLGSGNGKNAIYLAERGAQVSGLEISRVAIGRAKAMALEKDLTIDFRHASFGEKWPFSNNHFDLIIDVVSSNSLNEKELSVYLKELNRCLKAGGYFFVKTLCLDGDKNAQNLLINHPGPEKGTYVMPKTGIIERVFTEQEVRNIYKAFIIDVLQKKSSYTIFESKPFKRNFWLIYGRKPLNSRDS